MINIGNEFELGKILIIFSLKVYILNEKNNDNITVFQYTRLN